MKMKACLVGLLSVATLGVSTPQASAFLFHILHHRKCGRCAMTICCHPYNAFTPACFGHITCDGCCPIQSCPPQNCLPPACLAPLGPTHCGDPCAPGQPYVNWAPHGIAGLPLHQALQPNGQQAAPVTNGNGSTPNFVPPPPTPANPGSPMPNGPVSYNPYGVQQTGYYPMPAYYPAYNYPYNWGYYQAPAVPNYWYGQGW